MVLRSFYSDVAAVNALQPAVSKEFIFSISARKPHQQSTDITFELIMIPLFMLFSSVISRLAGTQFGSESNAVEHLTEL